MNNLGENEALSRQLQSEGVLWKQSVQTFLQRMSWWSKRKAIRTLFFDWETV